MLKFIEKQYEEVGVEELSILKKLQEHKLKNVVTMIQHHVLKSKRSSNLAMVFIFPYYAINLNYLIKEAKINLDI